MASEYDPVQSSLTANPTRVKILEITSSRSLTRSQLLSELGKGGYAGTENTLNGHLKEMEEYDLINRQSSSISVTKTGTEVLKKYRERFLQH
ncbi:MAG: helix-turn-helix domain-containing protein [Candidatus Aenigmatarchaeota archaeon]